MRSARIVEFPAEESSPWAIGELLNTSDNRAAAHAAMGDGVVRMLAVRRCPGVVLLVLGVVVTGKTSAPE